MRLVFAGTPAFAAVALDALLAAGHDIPLVLAQPDRPSGRGMKLTPGEVKQLARSRGLRFFQPATLKSEESRATLSAAGAQLMVVAAYGLILPRAILELFPRGCINIHASLLPRWRGAAPIQRALLAGDTQTGVCIMKMEEGLDTGPVYLSERVPIGMAETAGELHDRLAAVGARLVVEALDKIDRRALQPTPQPDEGVTYAHKIANEEAVIDWRDEAVRIDRMVRALNPVPGARTQFEGMTIKIWSARPQEQTHGEPGEVLSCGPQDIVVACGSGALRIAELQRAGGRKLAAREFLAGHRLVPGARFGA